MKTCNKCNISKSESKFYKNPSCRDGLNPSCIECHLKASSKGMDKKKCIHCEESYQPKAKNQKYCSIQCREHSQKEKRICSNCNTKFYLGVNGGRHKYCSDECYNTSKSIRAQKAYEPVSYDKIACRYCDNLFIPKRIDTQYCSEKCWIKDNKREPLERRCPNCNDAFTTLNPRHKYCSNECREHYKWHVTGQTKRRRRKYLRKRREEDPVYRLHKNMHASIYNALKENKAGRKWESLVGYTVGELKEHLESQFDENMTWDNYGEWHIDHIIPRSVFNYSKPEHIDFKRCWALDNLQPMWGKANIIKSNTLLESFQPCLKL